MKHFNFRFIAAVAASSFVFALAACGGGGGGGDGGGGSTGDSAVTPVAKPTITTPPVSQSVEAGKTATFTVTATGGGTLAYQWKKNGTDVSGASTSTYTTPDSAIADDGTKYSVAVTNSTGSVTSSEATLTVTAAPVVVTTKPAITTQPAAQTVVTGTPASFSVSASGTAPLGYQWKKDGTDISGATSPSYTTPATTKEDDGVKFSVVVSNSVGTATSNEAQLTVTATPEKPAITKQPEAQSVTEGQSATFSVTASGTAPFTYQWKKNGTDINGATSSTYTTPATSIGDSGAVFSVVVANSVGTATSNDARLTVYVLPAITTQPAGITIAAGATATFSVTATGTGTLSYQWKKNGVNITGGTGATANTYTTPAMSYAGNGAVYSVVVSNSAAGSVTSSTATLTVSKSSTPKSYGQVANASDGLHDKTECVQDNNTGLVWEGKTASGDRAGSNTYTNYDGTGVGQKTNGSTASAAEIAAGSNSIGYVNSVNAGSGLCGYTDWRMPTINELQGILASGSPRFDTTWFPNTQANFYWSSTPDGSGANVAYYVNFLDGYVDADINRQIGLHVRLVR